MTTCEECKNHIDVDPNEDIKAIVNYTVTPHHCNYFKRPLSVNEATLVPYRTRCEGFEWKEGAVLEEEGQMKNSVDWELAAKLVEEVREQKKFLEFCDNVETPQVVVEIAQNKARDGESITITIPSELLLPVVIEHLKAEHWSTLEALKNSALAEIVKDN
jgi:hypothetical protein